MGHIVNISALIYSMGMWTIVLGFFPPGNRSDRYCDFSNCVLDPKSCDYPAQGSGEATILPTTTRFPLMSGAREEG
jgi:hypothetical protein